MNADAIIRAALLAASPVANLVSTRVYPDIAEQDATRPFVVIQREQDDTTFHTLQGPSTLYQARFALACVADDKADTLDLVEAVREALDGYRAGDCQGMFFQGEASETLQEGYLSKVTFTGYFRR